MVCTPLDNAKGQYAFALGLLGELVARTVVAMGTAVDDSFRTEARAALIGDGEQPFSADLRTNVNDKVVMGGVNPAVCLAIS